MARPVDPIKISPLEARSQRSIQRRAATEARADPAEPAAPEPPDPVHPLARSAPARERRWQPPGAAHALCRPAASVDARRPIQRVVTGGGPGGARLEASRVPARGAGKSVRLPPGARDVVPRRRGVQAKGEGP